MDPIILANSSPSLLNKIDVGIPLKLKFFAKVVGGSKYISKFFISNSSKNFKAFSKLSLPIFIGIIFRLFKSL